VDGAGNTRPDSQRYQNERPSRDLSAGGRGSAQLRLGTKGVGQVPGSGEGANRHYIILFPELAAELKKMGFNQKDLQEEIYHRTSVRYEELNEMEIKSIRKAIELRVIPAGRRPVFEAALKAGGMVPVMIEPDDLFFFVAGGAPGCAFSFDYLRVPPYNYTAI